MTKAASPSISGADSSDDTPDSRHSFTEIIQVSGGSEKALGSGLSSPTSGRTATEDAAAISIDEKLSEEYRRRDHGDPEKTASSTSSTSYAYGHGHGHEIKAGRPDTATLIREAVSSTPAQGRVLVAACGPDGLMRVVRNTTASLIRGDGPGVELHCEQFGW